MILNMIKRITTYGDEVELNVPQIDNRYYVSDVIFIETRIITDSAINIVKAHLWLNSEDATI